MFGTVLEISLNIVFSYILHLFPTIVDYSISSKKVESETTLLNNICKHYQLGLVLNLFYK